MFSGVGGRKPRAVSLDPSVRGSAQDDDFVGGLEYNWLNMQKTRKIEKVTGSERNASQICRVTQRFMGAESKDLGAA